MLKNGHFKKTKKLFLFFKNFQTLWEKTGVDPMESPQAKRGSYRTIF